MKIFSPPPTPQPETLPADLARLGFKLLVRQQTPIIGRHPDPKKWRLDHAPVPLYILVSQQYGVGQGATLDEAIRAARQITGFCKYINQKRAEEEQTP
jgi:hypothetical protein